jgi:Holliday junction DNA helicase RuvA
MADRILMELSDRADELAASLTDAGAAPLATAESEARGQALSALLNLGYAKAQAERILDDAESEIGEGATVESYVRAALKRLAR